MPSLTTIVNDTSVIDDYELIRKRCDNFGDCKTEGEKWGKFISTYHFADQNEAAEYLGKKRIDVKKLFQGEKIKRKNSAVIANHLVGLWKKSINSVQFMDAYSGGDNLDEIMLTYLVSCVTTTAESVNLTERIEDEVAEYVDILNPANINEDLVADMVATTISDFVMDFGYHYLKQDQIDTARRVAKEQRLPCFNYTEKERKEQYDEESITMLFDNILTAAERYTPAYIANYNSWLEYMYVAFVAHINVPDYDREANDELKVVLTEIQQK